MRDVHKTSSLRHRLLLIANDRRFRAVAATLLSQRGYAVTVGGHGDDVIKLATLAHPDVIVIDVGSSLTAAAHQAARLDSLRPEVGIVAVSGDFQSGLATLPALSKWEAFQELFEAIARACPVTAAGPAREGSSRSE